MPNNENENENENENSTSKLPVTLKSIDFNYKKPEKRNQLVETTKYEIIDKTVVEHVRLGTNGVIYVPEEAFPKLFQTTKAKAAYIFENQIPDADKRNIDGQSYAHSSAVVGLEDRKSQEVRDAGKQAVFQYARDSLINISDSPEAQNMRRQVDAFTAKILPTLRDARGITYDEVTGEPAQQGFAFHHVWPKEIHTNPEDVVDPTKGRNLNQTTHSDVHKNNINDEEQFEAYKTERNSEKT